jgi:hypothetical protein
MATPIVVGDVYQVKVGCSFLNQVSINVLHYQCTLFTGLGAFDTALALFLDQQFAPLMKSVLTNTAAYYGVRVQRIKPAPLTIAEVSSTLPGPGAGGAAANPGQVSGVTTLQTNFGGRAFRGRLYAPFPSANAIDVVDMTPTAGYVLALNGFAPILTLPILVGGGGNTSTMVPCVYHRKDQTTTPITAIRGNKKWGTQRRRGNYGRPNALPPF